MSLSRRLRIARQRLRSLFRRDTVEAELDRELAFHLDALTAEKIADGVPPAIARDQARRELGNLTLIAEACRDTRRVGWIADLGQDVVYGVRVLRAEPGVAATAILSLAIGLGAAAAGWRGLDAARQGVLHLPDADRHVAITTTSAAASSRGATAIDFVAWRDRSQAFDLIAAALNVTHTINADAAGPAERVTGRAITAGYFDTLGARPLLGRVFTFEENRLLDPAPAVIISEALWRRRFNADPAVLTRTVRLDGTPRPIVGVMPDDTRYRDVPAGIWLPLRLLPTLEHGSGRALGVTARLRSGVTCAAAAQELNRIAASVAHEYGEPFAGWKVQVTPLDLARLSWSYEPLMIVTAIAMLVLLVAGANVSSLLFARALARQPETQRRIDLGATPGRLARQWLAESLVLGSAGGVAALAVAALGLGGLGALSPPPGAPDLRPLHLDGRTAAITAVLSIGMSLVLGGVAAWAARPRRRSTALWPRVRLGLTAVQLAITLAVLISTGLLANSLWRLHARDLNFNPDDLLTFEVIVPSTRTPTGTYGQRAVFDVTSSPDAALARLDDAFRAVPGVVSAGGSSTRAIDAFVRPAFDVHTEGRVIPAVFVTMVTHGYFATMQTSFVAGRDIASADTADTPWVAVVNESAAARLWPDRDPLGQVVRLDTVPDELPRRVVGVVRDIPLGNAATTASPVIYTSHRQQPARVVAPWINLLGTMTFVVRFQGSPHAVAAELRQAAARLEPDVPLAGVSLVRERLAAGRFRLIGLTQVAVLLAVAGVVLAIVGVYGVVAYGVRRQQTEIAVRRTLGARPVDIVRLVIGRVVPMVTAGLAAGLLGSALLSQGLRSYLWGVTAADPLTYAAGSIAIFGVAAAGCVAPIRAALAANLAAGLKNG